MQAAGCTWGSLERLQTEPKTLVDVNERGSSRASCRRRTVKRVSLLGSYSVAVDPFSASLTAVTVVSADCFGTLGFDMVRARGVQGWL
jgi:hypothetical protein